MKRWAYVTSKYSMMLLGIMLILSAPIAEAGDLLHWVATVHDSSASGSGNEVCPRPIVLPFYPDVHLWLKLNQLVASSLKCRGPPYGVEALPASGDGEAGSTEGPVKSVIITSRRLLEVAKELAKFHEKLGIETEVVTVENINSTFSPAEAPPVPLCSAEDLEGTWDKQLALKVVSFLREEVKHGVKYVVLLGGAKDVPPLYYFSGVLKELGSVSHCVPTDFFYGDPDYDYEVELAVGRIPLASKDGFRRYLEALQRWASGGNWTLRAFLVGGAPFAWTAFFGEAAVETVSSLPTMASMSRVDYGLLTEGTETKDRVLRSVGSYGMYFLVMHGSGNALVDYVPGGLWGYDFEEKLSVKDLPPRGLPGLYVSPSCLNAYWDHDVVPPPFKPPSLAEALLERGLAVAYVGSTRISVEIITGINVDKTVVQVKYAGTTWLQTLFIEALGLGVARLGDAWRIALTHYLKQPEPHYEVATRWGYEDLGVLIALESAFLGDPLAPNPWTLKGKHVVREPIAWSVEGAKLLDAPAGVVFSYSLRLVKGNITVLKVAPGATVTLKTSTCDISGVHMVRVSRVYAEKLIGVEEAKVEFDNCSISFTAPAGAPSMGVLLVHRGRVLERHYLILGGLKAVTEGGTVRVLQVGADLLTVTGLEPIYVLVNGTALVPLSVSVGEITVAPPFRGTLTIELVNARPYGLAVGGPMLARERGHLLKELFTAEVQLPKRSDLSLVVKPISAGRGAETYYVLVLLEDRLVNATLTHEVLEGKAEVLVKRRAPGRFVVTIEPIEGEIVAVKLCAHYRGSRQPLEAEGCRVIIVPTYHVVQPLERNSVRLISPSQLFIGALLTCALVVPLVARAVRGAVSSQETP